MSLLGVCQWRALNESVVLPSYKLITRGDVVICSHLPLMTEHLLSSLCFTAKEEQILQQGEDVKSLPKHCICIESSVFKCCEKNFVLC